LAGRVAALVRLLRLLDRAPSEATPRPLLAGRASDACRVTLARAADPWRVLLDRALAVARAGVLDGARERLALLDAGGRLLVIRCGCAAGRGGRDAAACAGGRRPGLLGAGRAAG
jgi:hypothetical protein